MINNRGAVAYCTVAHAHAVSHHGGRSLSLSLSVQWVRPGAHVIWVRLPSGCRFPWSVVFFVFCFPAFLFRALGQRLSRAGALVHFLTSFRQVSAFRFLSCVVVCVCGHTQTRVAWKTHLSSVGVWMTANNNMRRTATCCAHDYCAKFARTQTNSNPP